MRTAAPLSLLLLLSAGCSEYDLKSQEEPIAEVPDNKPPTASIDEPDIEVTPTFLDFGMLPKQCLSDTQTVRVENVGGDDLDVTEIRLVGSDKSNFKLNGHEPTVLAPGESFTFQVGFSPDVASNLSVNVLVSSNDPDESKVDVEALGAGTNDMTIEETWAQEVHEIVDILWVIDNSGSMSGEVAALGQVFDVFINQFVSLGLDYQIGVVTTDMSNQSQSGNLLGPIIHPGMANPVNQFNQQVNQGSSGSGDERAFDAANTALSAPLINAGNSGLVRPDSVLSIITITDEEEGSNLNGNAFIHWLNNYQGDPDMTSFSAIAGPEQTGLLPLPCITFATGQSAEPTIIYPHVVRQTGGVHANICQMDFATVLQMLGAVASGLKTQFELGYDAVETTIVVIVDGWTVPQDPNNGWSYDPATNTVTMNGNMVPPPGSNIDIAYETSTPCD